MSSRTWRWSVPVVGAALVAGAAATPAALASSAHPSLPARTAEQLLAAVQQSQVRALSGTVQTIADLGLPALPGRLSSAGMGLPALLAGTHTLTVASDGPQRQRLALLGDLTETDVIHNGADLWTYDSQTRTSTHRTLAARTARTGAAPSAEPGAADPAGLTPAGRAQQLLAALDPTTTVSVDRTARVVGRPAYQLVLVPRTAGTLIGSVRIAMDAATSVPLRVQVFAAHQSPTAKPAFQTGFTSVHFSRPAASTFAFVPPAGSLAPANPTRDAAPAHATPGTHPQPTTIGSGWSTIVALPAGTLGAATSAPATAANQGDTHPQGVAGLVDRFTTLVPGTGDRVLSTRLLSVLVTPTGRVLLGAVPVSALERAAAS